MANRYRKIVFSLLFIITLPLAGLASALNFPDTVFNIKDFGATGNGAESAQEAIQKAIDACAAAGGGTVYLPPGDYTSGTIHLRSHVRLFLEAGAALYSIKDDSNSNFLLFIFHRQPGRRES